MDNYQDALEHLDTISLLHLRNSLGDTISRVSHTDEPIIVTKNGKPIAAVVSIDDAVLVEKAKDRYYNNLVDEAQNEESTMMPFDELVGAIEADDSADKTE